VKLEAKGRGWLAEVSARVLRGLGFEILVATRSAFEELGSMRKYVKAADTAEEAVGIGMGASMVGVRAGVFMRTSELFRIAGSIREIVLSGTRGCLLILDLFDDRIYSDARLVSEMSLALHMEPLGYSTNRLKNTLERAMEVSEAIEVPGIISIPSHVKVISDDVLVEGITAPAIFSKHWEYPYRWIHKSFSINKERLSLLSRAYSRLFAMYEGVEFVDGEDIAVVSYGLGFAMVRDLIELLAPKRRPKVIGVPLHVPTWLVKSENGWISKLDDVSEVLVVESRLGLLSSILRRLFEKKVKHLPLDDLALVVKELGNKLKATNDLRKVMKDYDSRVGGIVYPRTRGLCPGCPYCALVYMLRKLYEEVKEKVFIVNASARGCMERVLETILVSKVRPDYDVKSRRYEPQVMADLIDVSYYTLDPTGLALGQSLAKYEGPILVIEESSGPMSRIALREGCAVVVCDFARTSKARGEVYSIYRDLIKASKRLTKWCRRGRGALLIILKGLCTRGVKSTYLAMIDREKCTGCGECLKLECPAIYMKDNTVLIDNELCVGCGLCVEVCPHGAISLKPLEHVG